MSQPVNFFFCFRLQVYCTLYSDRECGVCDASKTDKAHNVDLAIDGDEFSSSSSGVPPSTSWWQSPSLQYGPEFHYVTVTVDLKNVFQVRQQLNGKHKTSKTKS